MTAGASPTPRRLRAAPLPAVPRTFAARVAVAMSEILLDRTSCATWVPGHSPARRRNHILPSVVCLLPSIFHHLPSSIFHLPSTLLEQRRNTLVRVRESNGLRQQLADAQHAELRKVPLRGN